VPLNSQDTLSLVKFLPRDSGRKGIVIYYHGNKQNVEHYAESALNFTSRGYEVWMEDYPGYGKSRGERTELKLYEQALQVRKMAAGKYGPDRTIIYGRSLGSCLAAYIASVTPCKSLILETPYFSIPDLLNSFTYIYPSDYMSAYKLPTWKYLKEVSAPILIFHGTQDWVIPYRCAAKLRQYLKKSDQFVTIKKGGHNNLAQFLKFQQCIDSLLR
jgi:alpha-beta hydrolase superfamily lysophospholipase